MKYLAHESGVLEWSMVIKCNTEAAGCEIFHKYLSLSYTGIVKQQLNTVKCMTATFERYTRALFQKSLWIRDFEIIFFLKKRYAVSQLIRTDTIILLIFSHLQSQCTHSFHFFFFFLILKVDYKKSGPGPRSQEEFTKNCVKWKNKHYSQVANS